MTLTRRSTLIGLAACGAAGFARTARAQPAYPTGLSGIRIVVPFAPGGASDIIGRLVGEHLARKWNIAAALENIAGGSATVGIDRVAKGSADGSQIAILGVNFVTTQFILPRLPYDPEKDIVPLALLTRQANLLCVKKDLPVNTVDELIAYAKANPGKLNYASSGVGSPIHLAAELFKRMSGIEMTHVPFAGSAPSQNALAGGHVDVMFDNVAAIISLARSGAVKALAITSAERSPLVPQYPTVAETLPSYAAGGWLGAGVRAGTPRPICDAIEQACVEAMRDSATRERLAAIVSEPIGAGAADFSRHLAEERARFGPLIADLNIKM